MKSWLLSIASVSILSAVADMILPASHVSRYGKLCISLLLTSIIISPIIRNDSVKFDFNIPKVEYGSITDSSTLVDKEFSTRFTEVLVADTGFDNISVYAELDYDRIRRIKVVGAEQWQKDSINSTLLSKYNIATEIVTYESD